MGGTSGRRRTRVCVGGRRRREKGAAHRLVRGFIRRGAVRESRKERGETHRGEGGQGGGWAAQTHTGAGGLVQSQRASALIASAGQARAQHAQHAQHQRHRTPVRCVRAQRARVHGATTRGARAQPSLQQQTSGALCRAACAVREGQCGTKPFGAKTSPPPKVQRVGRERTQRHRTLRE